MATSDYTVVAPPPGSGCNASAVPAALIAWYPAQPGAASGLKVACKFTNAPSSSQVSPSYTIHDMNRAQYHNGAARRVTVAAATSGATALTASPGITGTGMGAWENRTITGPGIAPRTFVTSIAGDVLQLSRPTVAALAGGEVVVVENAPGARSVDDASGPPASTTIDSPSANFTAADIGLGIAGTGIPPNTTITAVNSATQVTISSSATFVDSGSPPAGVLTIGATLLTTTARQVTGATITAADAVTSAIAAFGPTDVGLRVAGTCDQLTSAPGDDYTVPAGTYVLATADPVATTTGGLTPGQSGCTLTIGEPSATAPLDGEEGANQGMQLDLDPSLVPGSGSCAQEQPEGIVLAARWYNPGSFEGAGASHAQPGPTPSDPAASPTKVIGQLRFGSSPLGFSAFVVERRTATPGDPIGAVHYDLQFPFVPVASVLCPGTATSPGLSFSLAVPAATRSQSVIAAGVGRPGTAQLRSVLPSATGGYTATAYVRSDSAVTFSPASAFNRLCIYPTGLPNPASFQCGPG
jgi:hypothetical protein